MSLVFGITRIVTFAQEERATDKESLLIYEFMTAYSELRRGVKKGDLRIHLSVEGSSEEVGAVFDEVERSEDQP